MILPLVIVIGSVSIWSIAIVSWTIVVGFQSVQLFLNTFQSFDQFINFIGWLSRWCIHHLERRVLALSIASFISSSSSNSLFQVLWTGGLHMEFQMWL